MSQSQPQPAESLDTTEQAVCTDCETTYTGSAVRACAAAHACKTGHTVRYSVTATFPADEHTPICTAATFPTLPDPEASPDSLNEHVAKADITTHSPTGSCEQCTHSFDGDTALPNATAHASRYNHTTSVTVSWLFDEPTVSSPEPEDRLTLHD